MIWNTFPTVTGQAADSVFGQTNLTSTAASIVPSLTSLNQPMALAGTGSMLFIADSFQYRVLAIPR